MLPQFASDGLYRFNYSHFATGITTFALGLFKKVVIADGFAVYVTPVFAAAESGQVIYFLDVWIASLAYTFQLYFDFSGYSEMELDIARMFGVRLPQIFSHRIKAIISQSSGVDGI